MPEMTKEDAETLVDRWDAINRAFESLKSSRIEDIGPRLIRLESEMLAMHQPIRRATWDALRKSDLEGAGMRK